jgi:hypothetical protein
VAAESPKGSEVRKNTKIKKEEINLLTPWNPLSAKNSGGICILYYRFAISMYVCNCLAILAGRVDMRL